MSEGQSHVPGLGPLACEFDFGMEKVVRQTDQSTMALSPSLPPLVVQSIPGKRES